MSSAGQRQYYFSLRISQQEFFKYYQGSADGVVVLSECGRRLRFPARRLRPFLTYKGIHGRFCLSVDSDNRFVSMQQISARR